MAIKLEKQALGDATLELVEYLLQDNQLTSQSINLLKVFIYEWNKLINSSYFSVIKPFNESFNYQIHQWYKGWSTGFEEEIKLVQSSNLDFRYMNVLDSVIVQTQKFLLAQNEAEERVIFNMGWIFERTVPYQAQWLTEQKLDIKTDLLPCYFPIDLEDFNKLEHLSYWKTPVGNNVNFTPYFNKLNKRKFIAHIAKVKKILEKSSNNSYKDQTFFQTKILLEQAYLKLFNHPEYQNKTYQGMSFARALEDFITAWINLVYGCTDRNMPIGSFEYQFRAWIEWAHRITLWSADTLFQGKPFKFPEALDLILDQTKEFLKAKTQEEIKQVIDIQYRIFKFPGERQEHLIKYVWLTKEKLDWDDSKVSKLYERFDEMDHYNRLPGYFPYDLTKRLKGKKLEEALKKWGYDSKRISDFIRIEDSYWQILNRALEKGLIINNYKEE